MKTKLAKKFMAMFFTLFMMISFVPIQAFAAEGDTNITEVNINGVSGELWSYKDVTFATVDENSNYTIESQKWTSTVGNITPSDTNLKPKVREDYSFIITLSAKDGYVFPTKAESNVFYDGIFKVSGTQYDDAVPIVTSNGKNLTATLFPLTTVKGATDPSGGSGTIVNTTVRDNYTDCQVTDDINLKKGSDYIIDFTKEDNLSMALRSMADLEKTKHYKFANSDNNSLIETENVSEALIKIVGNKSENKAIMTLVSDIDKSTSYTLSFIRTQYTGSKLTYTETVYDDKTGKFVIEEIRDDYYTRYKFNCKLNLIVDTQQNNIVELVEINGATLNFKDGDKPVFTGTIPDDAKYMIVYEAWKTDGEGISSDELFNYNDHLPIWGGKLITTFDKNKTYTYTFYFKTTAQSGEDSWVFGPNTKLKINGKEVEFVRDSSDNEQQFSGTAKLTMTPQESEENIEYKVIEGANSSWIQNTDEELTFRIDGDLSKFIGIKVDDEWVDSENYTTASGSTIVALKNEYLQSLSEGKHKITFVYTDGEVSTNFETKESGKSVKDSDNNETEESPKNSDNTKSEKFIKNSDITQTEEFIKNSDISKSDNPKTEDSSNIFLWTSLLTISFLGMIGITIYNKKKSMI